MNWTAILAPVLIEHLAPIAVTVAGAAVSIVVAKVGGAVRRKLNVDIDAQLNALLHAAIERTVAGLVARGTPRGAIVHETLTTLQKSNPDALKRFGLDVNPRLLADLISRAVDAQTGRPAPLRFPSSGA